VKTKRHNLHVYLGQDGYVDDTTDRLKINTHINTQIDRGIYCHMFYNCPDVLEAINYEPPSIVDYYHDIIDGKVTY